MRILTFDEWLEDQDEDKTLDLLREEYLLYVERMERRQERRGSKNINGENEK
ncbi:hypothetical protein [Rossellomorea marisflavi]|uniref:hypothetical protein n=1 Tax=Rossellomorea marisflavi TaxID=189381 RepID=UPI001653D2C0|nr:hypothetical protein [Rossellomorea marisflavi]